MGNATKVALVALLILLVVVIARLVRNDSEEAGAGEVGATTVSADGKPALAGVSQPAAGSRSQDKGAGAPQKGTKPPPYTKVETRTPGGTATSPGTGTITARTSNDPASRDPTAKESPGSAGAAGASGGALASGESPAGGGYGKILPPLPPPHPLESSGFSVRGSERPQDPAKSSQPGFRAGEPAGRPPAIMPSLDGTLPAATQLPGRPPQAPGVVGSLSEKRDGAGTLTPPVSEGQRPSIAPKTGTDGGTAKATPPLRGSGEGSLGSQGFTQPVTTPSVPGGTGLDGAKKGAEGIAGSQAGQGQFPQTYVIQENDSYWRLADRFYGDGTLMAYIEKANPEVKMQPGRKLVIPPPPAVATPAAKPGDPAPSGATGQLQKGELPKEEPPAASGTGFAAKAPGIVGAGPGYRVYHVEKGETFWSIARKFYGDSKKYTRVLEEANPEQKKGLLAGARIKIPDPPAQR